MMKSDKLFYVYEIVNKRNGRVYVGSTCNKQRHRFQTHWWRRNNPSNDLHRDMAAQCFEDFEMRIVFDGIPDKETARWLEGRWTQVRREDSDCYNIATGDQPSDGQKVYLALGPKSSSIKVRCVDTGVVFESGSAAGRSLGLSTSAVNSAIRKGCRCAGMMWEQVLNYEVSNED